KVEDKHGMFCKYLSTYTDEYQSCEK
ncbi:hypothetical protein, partial [Bacillus spizizenii]